MPAYARNRPTKQQIQQRDHNRRVIDGMREHNAAQEQKLQRHNRTVMEESLKDKAVRKRLEDQLDGHASRHSDDDAVESFIRSVGAENLRFKP